MKMEQTECSETSAYKIQTPGNYPEENIQHLRDLFGVPSLAYGTNFHDYETHKTVLCKSQMVPPIFMTVKHTKLYCVSHRWCHQLFPRTCVVMITIPTI
jgi:hypothetical protein